jgi:hypothetical protein
MATKYEMQTLQALIGAQDCEVVHEANVPQGRIVWTLWDEDRPIGQLQYSEGEQYAPDGYSAYMEGHNWTDALPTPYACAAQLAERRYAY